MLQSTTAAQAAAPILMTFPQYLWSKYRFSPAGSFSDVISGTGRVALSTALMESCHCRPSEATPREIASAGFARLAMTPRRSRMPITAAQLDRLAIAELVDNWAMWRDIGRWDDFRTCWHAEGVMMATWFQGGFEEFIRVSQQGFARGSRTSHFQGGKGIDLKGKRAIAQTKMQIAQRGDIEGVVCDVVCGGRFYDFLEKRQGRWGIVLRQPIYERDRINPVDPAATVRLDAGLLARFPEGYRHLAYLQTKNGQNVKADMPGLIGPALDALYARGAAWLAGKPLAQRLARRQSTIL